MERQYIQKYNDFLKESSGTQNGEGGLEKYEVMISDARANLDSVVEGLYADNGYSELAIDVKLPYMLTKSDNYSHHIDYTDSIDYNGLSSAIQQYAQNKLLLLQSKYPDYKFSMSGQGKGWFTIDQGIYDTLLTDLSDVEDVFYSGEYNTSNENSLIELLERVEKFTNDLENIHNDVTTILNNVKSIMVDSFQKSIDDIIGKLKQ